jgi:hypothetical protein
MIDYLILLMVDSKHNTLLCCQDSLYVRIEPLGYFTASEAEGSDVSLTH